MKLRTVVLAIIALSAVGAAALYIRDSLRQASQPPIAGPPVRLEGAPFRVYGLVEPCQREVFVGPRQAGRVVAIFVKEGEEVVKDQALLRLDDDVERQAWRLAASRLEEAVRRLDLTRDELRRKEALLQRKAIPEFDFSQIKLQAKIAEQQIASARAEVELRRVEMEKLTLRAPMAGRIYKFDVRLGEQLTPQDYRRIILGRVDKQVRLFVETFWFGRIKVGDRFVVKTADKLQDIGLGEVVEIVPYVGERDFRTEDRLERLDTKYLQTILHLKTAQELPLGLQVVADRLEK